jgi:hypothetical protein
VPWAIANATYKRQFKNPNRTEITEIRGRGHSLVFDRGWQEVADTALSFLAEQGVTASGARPPDLEELAFDLAEERLGEPFELRPAEPDPIPDVEPGRGGGHLRLPPP